MTMTLTNQTTQDYWFGPLHIAGGVGSTLPVDDTTATSLYLKSDDVADAINFAVATGKVTATGAAAPFPRATGTPTTKSGDGSPEGLVYASQGTVYLRRDKALVYQKTTAVNLNTGWTVLSQAGREQAKRIGMGYAGECWSRDTQRDTLTFTTGDFKAVACGFLSGDVVTNIIANVSGAFTTPTLFKVGLYDATGNLLASSANTTGVLTSTGMKSVALSTPYTITTDGLYYIGLVVAAGTMGSFGGLSGFTGKEAAISGALAGAFTKAGQADIPTTLGSTSADSTPWLGWN